MDQPFECVELLVRALLLWESGSQRTTDEHNEEYHNGSSYILTTERILLYSYRPLQSHVVREALPLEHVQRDQRLCKTTTNDPFIAVEGLKVSAMAHYVAASSVAAYRMQP